jgi:hypothetical protein
LNQLGWARQAIVKDESQVYSGRTIMLERDDIKLDINIREDERQISLSKHLYLDVPSSDTTYTSIVKKIAEAFNHQLSQGEYQQYFDQPLRENY